MKYILLVAALILSQNYTPIQAAPPFESCPADSILSGDVCKCNPDSCLKPPCLSVLSVAKNGSDLPGSCCPIYDCVDCKNDTLVDGRCPCAPEAVLNSKNQCECIDKEKHLVKGECVCNPLQCKFPILCDRKSVRITIREGCCNKTICKSCPSDSESTHLESDEIEDVCVCLPCKTECGPNRTVEIKKRGTGFPGNCCDLYECKEIDEMKGCNVDDVFYKNGEEWSTADMHQKCKCQNGLSLCSNIIEQTLQSCFKDHKIYKHGANWTKEDGCTYCTCMNGEEKCISHFCEVKESQIQNNDSQPCLMEVHIYQHLESWREKDGCTYCKCINGEVKCTQEICNKNPDIKKNECQPLANCNKTCINGFKINKKGCEICKCNGMKFPHNILEKYNITMEDLVTILENYKDQRTSTSTTSTTTIPVPIVEAISTGIPISTNEFAKKFDGTLSSTTEPSVVPTEKDSGYWNIALPIVALLSIGCVILIIVIIMCIYKNRRRSSLDISNCQYESVNNLNNNNTIKKTEQLL